MEDLNLPLIHTAFRETFDDQTKIIVDVQGDHVVYAEEDDFFAVRFFLFPNDQIEFSKWHRPVKDRPSWRLAVKFYRSQLEEEGEELVFLREPSSARKAMDDEEDEEDEEKKKKRKKWPRGEEEDEEEEDDPQLPSAAKAQITAIATQLGGGAVPVGERFMVKFPRKTSLGDVRERLLETGFVYEDLQYRLEDIVARPALKDGSVTVNLLYDPDTDENFSPPPPQAAKKITNNKKKSTIAAKSTFGLNPADLFQRTTILGQLPVRTKSRSGAHVLSWPLQDPENSGSAAFHTVTVALKSKGFMQVKTGPGQPERDGGPFQQFFGGGRYISVQARAKRRDGEHTVLRVYAEKDRSQTGEQARPDDTISKEAYLAAKATIASMVSATSTKAILPCEAKAVKFIDEGKRHIGLYATVWDERDCQNDRMTREAIAPFVGKGEPLMLWKHGVDAHFGSNPIGRWLANKFKADDYGLWVEGIIGNDEYGNEAWKRIQSAKSFGASVGSIWYLVQKSQRDYDGSRAIQRWPLLEISLMEGGKQCVPSAQSKIDQDLFAGFAQVATKMGLNLPDDVIDASGHATA